MVDHRTLRLMALLVTAVGAVVFVYDNVFLAENPTVDGELEDGTIAIVEGPLRAHFPAPKPMRGRGDWRGNPQRRAALLAAATAARNKSYTVTVVQRSPIRTAELPPEYVVGVDRLLDRLVSIEQQIVESRKKKPNVIMRGTKWTQRRDMDTYRTSLRRAGLMLVDDAPGVEYSGILCVGIGDLNEDCLEGSQYPQLERYQKISRIQGMRRILWTKDGFCRTMASALRSYVSADSMTPFSFPCWTVPRNLPSLIMYDEKKKKGGEDVKYIVKPTNSGAGKGIFVVDSAASLTKIKHDMIVQPYLNNPYLIDGYKFDLRTYVLVTSISPLRIYMYQEGLVRFASSKYSSNVTAGGKKTQFLTNTSINKKFKDVNELVWRFAKFKDYLKSAGENPDEIFGRIYQAVTHIFISSEASFRRHFEKLQSGYTCINCYQLLGVDVIFDEFLTPRVIEVNGSPDMGLSHAKGSSYDATKIGMMTDVFSVVYRRTTVAFELAADLRKLNAGMKPYCKASTRYCLDDIDLEYLLDAKRERMNRGGFTRLYPTVRGEVFADYIRHVDRLASDAKSIENLGEEKALNARDNRGTWRLHRLLMDLEKMYAGPAVAAGANGLKAAATQQIKKGMALPPTKNVAAKKPRPQAPAGQVAPAAPNGSQQQEAIPEEQNQLQAAPEPQGAPSQVDGANKQAPVDSPLQENGDSGALPVEGGTAPGPQEPNPVGR